MPEHDSRHHPHRRTSDHHRIRTILDSRPFWVGLAFVIVSGLLIFSTVTYSRESTDRAARKASAQAQYQDCLASVPALHQFQQFIVGVRAVGDVLLLNSVQMHQITPRGSPVYHQQQINITRLRRALNRQKGTKVPQLTVADCKDRLVHPRG